MQNKEVKPNLSIGGQQFEVKIPLGCLAIPFGALAALLLYKRLHSQLDK